MSIHIIPVNKLSAKVLKRVIEEFISRDGTDYGAIEVSFETNFKQVKYKLKNGLVVLVFDDETETTNDIGMTAREQSKKGRTIHITLKYSDFHVVTR